MSVDAQLYCSPDHMRLRTRLLQQRDDRANR
jgi:hypothetical protein